MPRTSEMNEDAGPQVTVKRGPESGSPDEVATVPLSEYMMPDGTVVYKER